VRHASFERAEPNSFLSFIDGVESVGTCRPTGTFYRHGPDFEDTVDVNINKPSQSSRCARVGILLVDLKIFAKKRKKGKTNRFPWDLAFGELMQ
jgi:hypothetical protein